MRMILEMVSDICVGKFGLLSLLFEVMYTYQRSHTDPSFVSLNIGTVLRNITL